MAPSPKSSSPDTVEVGKYKVWPPQWCILSTHLAQLHGGDAAPTISVKEGENILVLSQLCLGQSLSGLHGIQTIV